MDEPPPNDTGPAQLLQIKDSIVTGGTFNIFAARSNDEDITSVSSGSNGADGSFRRNERPQSLEDIVAFDALLNSGERYPAPKCHPDTRKAAQEIVKSWIWNSGTGFQFIMWVSGAPGVGKSALLQTTCEALAGAYNPIHASFFFSRGQGARELAASLPPTIAYQFTISSIVCRWYIWYLLRNDPTILREAFHSQFRKLVTTPAFARSYVQRPMVVVIDGLDECVNVQDRVTLLELIFEAAKTLCIRFLIASRPEQEIENFFKRADVAQHVDHIVLDEETFETSKDIRVFLHSEFARIRLSRPDLIFDFIDGEEWPGGAIIDRVTVDSDGQFIFATLFIGYLDDDLFSPQEQLETLLSPPAHAGAFSKLDRLYQQILTRRPRNTHQSDAKFAQYQEIVKGILQVVIVWPEQRPISGIAGVLGEEVHIVQNIVQGPLRTLFKFQGSGTDSKIALCHKSLGDCLMDPRRSGQFHVPENALDLIYLRALSRPAMSNPTQAFSQKQLLWVLYVVVAWSEDVSERQIALMLGLDSRVVSRVVAHYKGFLFDDWFKYTPTFYRAFKEFLLDANRCKQFRMPTNALDPVYLHLLSHPPLTDAAETISREWLVGVLHVVVAWPERMTDNGIAVVLGLDITTVERVTVPFMGLLFNHEYGGGKAVKFHAQYFEDFLLDPDRSGEYHVPPNALDLLYSHILFRPPPSNPAQTSQDELIRVLRVLVAWPEPLAEEGIAAVLGLDSVTVGRVLAPFMGLLFKHSDFGMGKIVTIRWQSFEDFLLDPHRSGAFHVPPNARDLLYFRILSHPPQSTPAETLSQEQLVGVLQTAAAWPGRLTEVEIGSVLGLASPVVVPFMGLLFRKNTAGAIDISKPFKDFLLDPSRSGEYHVPPNARDLLYLRMLSHPPPSSSTEAFSRDQLVDVLRVLTAWPEWLSEDGIAAVLGVDRDVVSRVIATFMGLLFETSSWGTRIQLSSFVAFLLDPYRSGEFHVPLNTVDVLYHRVLSRPPPTDPAQTFSQDHLLDVLHSAMDNQLSVVSTTNDESSNTTPSAPDSDTVRKVTSGPQRILFKASDDGSVHLFHISLATFLADPRRSEKFHNPSFESPIAVLTICGPRSSRESPSFVVLPLSLAIEMMRQP